MGLTKTFIIKLAIVITVAATEGADNSTVSNDVESLPRHRMSENNIFPSLLDNLVLSNARSEFARNRTRRDTLENPTDVTFDTRIAGGKPTLLEQFPWAVLLVITFDYTHEKKKFNCGGSLIGSKYVLTAAHCLHDKNGGTLSNLKVYLAEYNKQTFPRDCIYVFGVGEQCIENVLMYGDNVILHSEYNSTWLFHDIALIRLRGTAPKSNYIQTIYLPPFNVDRRENSNLALAVVGWGQDGPYRSDLKQSAVINLVPYEECKRYYPYLIPQQLCAVGHTGEDTCKGDSGGPLSMVYNKKPVIVGIVSGKRPDYECGTSVPSLYTNVYPYLDWILSNVKN